MKRIMKIDGIRLRVQNRDLDGDGVTGGTENITKQTGRGVTEIKESTELKDAIVEFNKDEKNSEGLSSIDFMGSIDSDWEKAPLVALDSAVGLGIVTKRSGIVGRIVMRKNVSNKMAGRKQYVELVVGKKMQDQATAGQKAQNFTGMGSN